MSTKDKKKYLGIDAGSIAVAAVLVDEEGRILRWEYYFHEGDIRTKVEKFIEEYKPGEIQAIGITSSTPDIIESANIYDSRVCFIRSACRDGRKPGTLLIVGGEKFGVVTFDEEGNYLNYRSNSSCAAGTGSFLDQQARRLNLKTIQEFSETAFTNKGDIPKIASRCAVFAKTDLIHAQQEGYSLDEICDGLCFGLAKNIVDTLFDNSNPVLPLIMTGGVSKNPAVTQHLEKLIGVELEVEEMSHLYGALGAVLCMLGDSSSKQLAENVFPRELLRKESKEKKYYYKPLKLELSNYPEFSSFEKYNFNSIKNPGSTPVEVDIYMALQAGQSEEVFLGIDIGSTSTKAVITNTNSEVIAGLYTRTSGRPVAAVQTIFEAVADIEEKKGIKFVTCGAGTTGSGRKLIGRIIGADLELDEITAHARAAAQLDPEVDTIIEIGGQDAKFTTLKNGMVTFSIMNNVCAAGTGSFIEEQARKLGCPLSEYSKRAEGREAPLSSDRCTVFMERDLNSFLTEGFDVDEILASVLHSVRDNYLTKVAVEKNIGKKIFFQGATARNRALVAAFEQRLKKPIMVSPYCHLTGALGVALCLQEMRLETTAFRGIGIYSETIPVKTEICDLCTNHCKIKIAEVGSQTVAFGFLCGRDYDTRKFINTNTSGFDLFKERSRVSTVSPLSDGKQQVVVGLPAALHLFEDIPMWKFFFKELGIKTLTSEGLRDAVKTGKRLSGAEFCAPVSEMHGHVRYLSERADYIFIPTYLERRDRRASRKNRRQYCYYTQFISSLVEEAGCMGGAKIISPLLYSLNPGFFMLKELYDAVNQITGGKVSFRQIFKALKAAEKFSEKVKKSLIDIYDKNRDREGLNVILLGRPYTILSKGMNKGIPDIFARLGVRVFYMDMVESRAKSIADVKGLLSAFHWNYAAKIIEYASYASRTEGVYPVLITSFKCTPDAYAVDYFKKIMDEAGKPYLVLQIDEHDSNVGYETRIEAGIRSFRNHLYEKEQKKTSFAKSGVVPVVKRGRKALAGKTLLLANWDDILGRFMTANLQREGVDARLLEEDEAMIHRSLSTNSGQCIPLNIIVHECVEYVRKYSLDPEKTVLWNIESRISCNLGMFPYYAKTLLEDYGDGNEKIDVYAGAISFYEMPVRASINMYLAFMFSGYLRLMGCRIRPYEAVTGTTDGVIEASASKLEEAFKKGSDFTAVLENIIKDFETIKIIPGKRPRVAIFGDFYVRDNRVMNQDIIRVIENNGGEVITTPYSELIKIIAAPYLKKWVKEGNYLEVVTSKVLLKAISLFENRYYKYFYRILKEPAQEFSMNPVDVLKKFNVRIEQSGESVENILKLYSLASHNKDISLFVQLNPAFCCPSLVTEAMAGEIERVTGIPIVTIEYDGTSGLKNEDIIPYLIFRKEKNIAEERIRGIDKYEVCAVGKEANLPD